MAAIIQQLMQQGGGFNQGGNWQNWQPPGGPLRPPTRPTYNPNQAAQLRQSVAPIGNFSSVPMPRPAPMQPTPSTTQTQDPNQFYFPQLIGTSPGGGMYPSINTPPANVPPGSLDIPTGG